MRYDFNASHAHLRSMRRTGNIIAGLASLLLILPFALFFDYGINADSVTTVIVLIAIMLMPVVGLLTVNKQSADAYQRQLDQLDREGKLTR